MEIFKYNFLNEETGTTNKFKFLPESENLLSSAKTKIQNRGEINLRSLYQNDTYKTNIDSIYINKYENVRFNITDNVNANTQWPAVLGTNIVNIKKIKSKNNLKIMPIIFIWGDSWQHFMQDNFPILCYLLPFIKENPDITLLFKNLNSDLKYIISLLNIKNSMIFSNDKRFDCKELYHIHFTPNATIYWWPPVLFQKTNELMIKTEYSIKQDKLIYISRNNVNTRRISNEEEIVTFLREKAKEQNLEFIYFVHSSFNVKDRIKIFKEAKIVIAPHGGANYHILFCQPGTKFIEICFVDLMNCLCNIATSIGLDYWMLPINGNQNSHSCPVDIKMLKKIIINNRI